MDDTIRVELEKPVDPKLVKTRKVQGRDVSYLEGYVVIDQANRIFGFDGWSYDVRHVSALNFGGQVAYEAIVTVQVGAVGRSDVGYCLAQAGQNQAQAHPAQHEMAAKGAVTDALKRAFRSFGAQFGNSLYGDTDASAWTPPAPAQAAPPAAQVAEANALGW